MKGKIVIVDYGMGNLFSVKKKLDFFKTENVVSSNYNDIVTADKIILPGVGHFKKAIENLETLNLIEPLNEAVVIKKKMILGICLGMQLMALDSEEGNVNGLGWFNANVVKFKTEFPVKYKIPHTGWNQINIEKQSNLMKNISNGTEMYFVHSYHFICHEKQDVLNSTDYEYNFVSAIEQENMFGVQYHPEKSHLAGELLLKNFIDL